MSKEVIIFTGATCAPCKVVKPELEFQAAQRGFPLRVVEMKAENAAVFSQYGVRSVPTVVCHDGETEIGRFIGAQTANAIEARLIEWGF